MPLWTIYHPPTVFADPASKSALATAVTSIYTAIGLPAFYVVVNFLCVPASNTFVGGTPKSSSTSPFVRVVIEHIAVTQPDDDAAYKRVRDRVGGVLKGHMREGWEYEWHVGETERRLWMINGIAPPGFGSEAERVWVRENRAVAWE